MFSSQSESYDAPARARNRQPARASREIVAAETHVSYALATFAQRSQVTNKRKHHTLRERPERTSRRAVSDSVATRNVAPARTRVDDSPVLFTNVRQFNDPALRAEYDALALAQFRAECERKRTLAKRS
jgi:hypothetical protein